MVYHFACPLQARAAVERCVTTIVTMVTRYLVPACGVHILALLVAPAMENAMLALVLDVGSCRRQPLFARTIARTSHFRSEKVCFMTQPKRPVDSESSSQKRSHREPQDRTDPEGTSTSPPPPSSTFDPALNELRTQAQRVTEHVSAIAKSRLQETKAQIADDLAHVANAMQQGARALPEHYPFLVRWMQDSAAGLEDFSLEVACRDLEELPDEAERIARKHPLLFLTGSLATGVMISRFLKSSAETPPAASSAPNETGR